MPTAKHGLVAAMLFAVQILLLSQTGCRPPGAETSDPDESVVEQPTEAETGPLQLLVLDSPQLAETLRREWAANSSTGIELQQQTSAELLQALAGGQRKLVTDVVVFPPTMLGELAQRQLIRALSADFARDPQLGQGEFFMQIRRREINWGTRQYALPLGSPVLTLLYRPDLVESPPQTWEQLSAEVQRLRTSLPDRVSPLLQPTAPGWGARMLLARSASYMFSRQRVSTVFDYATLEPLLSSPAMVRALKELQGDFNAASQSAEPALAPAQVWEQFIAGHAAMAICWPCNSMPAGQAAAESSEGADTAVGIAPLPGTDARFQLRSQQWVDTESTARTGLSGVSGLMLAISRSAPHAKLASRFVRWAAGREQATQLTGRTPTLAPFRESQLPAIGRWAPKLPAAQAAEYGQILKQTLDGDCWHLPRLPAADEYLSELDKAVQLALSGKQPPEQALADAAARWQAITDRLGREKQVDAYQRSLGVGTQ